VGRKPSEAEISNVMAELGRRGAAATNSIMDDDQKRERASKGGKSRWQKARGRIADIADAVHDHFAGLSEPGTPRRKKAANLKNGAAKPKVN
jgi:hypothetical protein